MLTKFDLLFQPLQSRSEPIMYTKSGKWFLEQCGSRSVDLTSPKRAHYTSNKRDDMGDYYMDDSTYSSLIKGMYHG